MHSSEVLVLRCAFIKTGCKRDETLSSDVLTFSKSCSLTTVPCEMVEVNVCFLNFQNHEKSPK